MLSPMCQVVQGCRHGLSVLSSRQAKECQGLVGTEYDIGLRVTFDTDLDYRADHLELQEETSGLMLLPPDWTVVEIQVNVGRRLFGLSYLGRIRTSDW